jgi:hypothetical protein
MADRRPKAGAAAGARSASLQEMLKRIPPADWALFEAAGAPAAFELAALAPSGDDRTPHDLRRRPDRQCLVVSRMRAADHDGLGEPGGSGHTDPNWEADWHRGIAIGLLVIVGLAVVMAIVRPQRGSSEAPVATQLYPEWPA